MPIDKSKNDQVVFIFFYLSTMYMKFAHILYQMYFASDSYGNNFNVWKIFNTCLNVLGRTRC